MKKLTLFILFLVTLVGLHIAAPAAIAISEPDDPDEVVSDDVNDDDNEPLAATQDQNAAAAASTAATPNLGTIQVGPSASGEAVRILSTAFALQPLSGDVCLTCLGIIVGPGDLFTPSIIDQLRAAYEAGHAVGLTNATQASIERLHDLLEHHGSAQPVPGGAHVDLAAFRKSRRSDGQFHFSSHLLLPREAASAGLTTKDQQRLKRASKSLSRKLKRKLRRLANRLERQQKTLADSNDIEALSKIFSATPDVPEPPPGGNPQQNLLQLAESYESHAIQSDSYGNQVQLVNTVWAARSFLNPTDLYYLLQEVDYHVVPQIILGGIFNFNLQSWNNSVQSLLGGIAGSPTLLQPSPQTTMEATVDTSSVSHTIGGSAGWNQAQGLNASVSGSVTISNSKTTTIPPINITNDANLVTGQTSWTYDVNDIPQNAETIDLFSQWIWDVPFTAYGTDQEEIQFSSAANLGAGYAHPFINKTISVNLPVNLLSKVPLPFGRTFALQPPAVTSVSPTSVNEGTTFTINGTGFYPSLVTAVLIGGTQVNPANITTVSDTQIDVVAPGFDFCELGCTVVVQTTQGTSNDNVTISIIPIP
jgi:hypothetical protein